MRLVGILLSLVLAAACSTGLLVAAPAYTAPSIDGSFGDWAAIPNHLSDTLRDVSGGGQPEWDILDLWVANDDPALPSPNLYACWRVNRATISSTALGLILDTNRDGTADAVCWVSFNNKGVMSVQVERPIGTLTTVGSGAYNFATHPGYVEASWPISQLGMTTYLNVLWGETHASPSLTSQVKDRVPDSGTMTIDLRTGLWHSTPSNQAPSYTFVPTNTSQTIDEGQGLTAVVATDPNGGPLTYSLTSGSLPDGITVNPDGTFSGTASYASSGTYSVVITVSDAWGATDTTTLVITVNDVNRAPEYTGDSWNTSQAISDWTLTARGPSECHAGRKAQLDGVRGSRDGESVVPRGARLGIVFLRSVV